MAIECEHIFIAAESTITPETYALAEKAIEVYECLQWWWRTGATSDRLVVAPMIPRANV
jgi:hypothetical protein